MVLTQYRYPPIYLSCLVHKQHYCHTYKFHYEDKKNEDLSASIVQVTDSSCGGGVSKHFVFTKMEYYYEYVYDLPIVKFQVLFCK